MGAEKTPGEAFGLRASKLPQMRTIQKLVAQAKELDPETCITESSIRLLVKSGKLPCVKVGRKTLVSVEAVEAYFNMGLG